MKSALSFVKYVVTVVILLIIGAVVYLDYTQQKQLRTDDEVKLKELQARIVQLQGDQQKAQTDGTERDGQVKDTQSRLEALSAQVQAVHGSAGELRDLSEKITHHPVPPPPTTTTTTPAPTVALAPLVPVPLVHPTLDLGGEGGSSSGGSSTSTPGAYKVDLTVYAIWDQIGSADEATIRAQMDRLLTQFGKGNATYHPGFAFIFPGVGPTERVARIAKEKHLSIGVIAGIQSHTGSHEVYNADLRSFQWRMKDNNWQGYYSPKKDSSGKMEISDGPRDYCVPSPSRYSPLAQEHLIGRAHDAGRQIKQVMDEVPGVITCVNGVIEEELAIAAATTSNDYLADYSPFAVAEFRDWLCHTGEYDDVKGKYKGQGAPASIVGDFITIDGVQTSPFHDDPDPDSANGTGASFNQTFATSFKTWDLKYWDLKKFPEKITDTGFKPMPAEGEKGFTADGFDAPRQLGHSKFWNAWSWDFGDENSTYPKGNPANPAFGFRQTEVHHFVEDVFDAMAAEGVPRNLMYAHQIPGEQVGAPRCRSGADPVWTGYLPQSGSVGITCFGWFNPERALQYSDLTPDNHGWGIFEWHPYPGADPKGQILYNRAMKELIVYSKHNCRNLFAGWWTLPEKETGGDAAAKDGYKTFPLADSMFAKAIHDFMETTPDHPPTEPADPGGDVGKIR